MNMHTESKAFVRTSKKLSWLLRHGAAEAGLPMDAAGWAAADDVMRLLRISRSALEEQVARNTKRRLQLVDDRIRCCQGHSTATMPVTLEALEDSWMLYRGAGLIWHGTNLSALPGIEQTGLKALRRTHVHLAEALDSTVGKRSKVAVMLAVCPQRQASAGFPVFASPNGVLLTRRVPRSCIVGVRPMTRRAIARADALYDQFGEA
jgi:putative RNA 2'-phosphotransferase